MQEEKHLPPKRQVLWIQGKLLGEHSLQVHEAGQAVLLDHVGLALNQRQAVVNEGLGHAVALGVDPLARELLFEVGNVGEVEISDKQLNGFKVAFTGSAKSVTLKLFIKGGTI